MFTIITAPTAVGSCVSAGSESDEPPFESDEPPPPPPVEFDEPPGPGESEEPTSVQDPFPLHRSV